METTTMPLDSKKGLSMSWHHGTSRSEEEHTRRSFTNHTTGLILPEQQQNLHYPTSPIRRSRSNVPDDNSDDDTTTRMETTSSLLLLHHPSPIRRSSRHNSNSSTDSSNTIVTSSSTHQQRLQRWCPKRTITTAVVTPPQPQSSSLMRFRMLLLIVLVAIMVVLNLISRTMVLVVTTLPTGSSGGTTITTTTVIHNTNNFNNNAATTTAETPVLSSQHSQPREPPKITMSLVKRGNKYVSMNTTDYRNGTVKTSIQNLVDKAKQMVQNGLHRATATTNNSTTSETSSSKQPKSTLSLVKRGNKYVSMNTTDYRNGTVKTSVKYLLGKTKQMVQNQLHHPNNDNNNNPTTSTTAVVNETTTTTSPSNNNVATRNNVTNQTTAPTQQATKPDADPTNNNNSTTTTTAPVVTTGGPIQIRWNGLKDMNAFVESIWGGNLFCSTIWNARTQAVTSSPPPRIVLTIRFGCQELFELSETGTGNFIQAIYMMKLSSMILGNIEIDMTCQDATEQQRNLVLPWLTGHWIYNDPPQQRQVVTPMPTAAPTAAPTLVNSSSLLTPLTNPSATKTSSLRRASATTNNVPPTDAVVPTLADALVTFGKNRRNRSGTRPEQIGCSRFVDSPIGLIHPMMQYDLRKMAIGLVGTIGPNHPSTRFAELYLWNKTLATTSSGFDAGSVADTWNVTSSSIPQLAIPQRNTKPLYTGVEMDDAIIHFRCGDLLTTKLTSYGFMTFDGYSRHISSQARKIGIVTQSFHNATTTTKAPLQQRSLDGDVVSRQRCQALVMALQAHVQERFPLAKVSLRNEPSETIALSYARMIMANQTIGAMSTFSVFPAVACFGTGYFLRPKGYEPSLWLSNHPTYVDTLTGKSNIVLFDEQIFLPGPRVRDLWDTNGTEAVLAWFESS